MKFNCTRLLAIVLLFVAFSANAQNAKLKKADRYFELFKFEKAIDQYKRYVEKNPDSYVATKRIADSYRLLGNSQEAEFWYAETIKSSEAEPIDFWHYAQTLRDNAKYTQAKVYYTKYDEKAPEDPRGKRLATAMTEVAKLKADSLKYKVWNLDSLNTPAYEFSPVYYGEDGLAFVSNRNSTGRKNDVWTGGADFLDLFTTEVTDSGYANTMQMPGKVNTKYHEGPMAFTSDFSKIYFTRNSYVKRKKPSEEDIVMLNIYSSKMEDGEWQKVESLPFNSTEYSTGHPALSADGKTMIFSSDMPNGFGGLDLWKVEWRDSAWSTPINLGDEVNTKGDEQFPSLTKDGDLYFASNSYEGLGGLDIYEAKKDGSKWTNVTNMGYPINSAGDDFGLVWNASGDGGYFTSNRSGGYGEDDIYAFDNKALKLDGIVYDRLTGDPIDSATVYLVQGSDTLGMQTTNDKGEFNFIAQQGLIYDLPASKEGYMPNKLNINTANRTNDSPPIRIPLDRGDLMLVGITYEVKVNDETLEEERIGTLGGVTVRLFNETDGTVDSTTTDSDGNFGFKLDPEKSYRLDGDKDFYFLKSELTFSTEGKTGGVVEAELELYKIAGVIRLVNIYYDFDKYNIRPDAAKELDRVFGIISKYPDLKIQMRSHTDCRGTKFYNMVLSANRAQSAANYLIKKGMDNNLDMLKNITAAGFGETVPIYADLCATEQGIRDAELPKETIDKHQMNRRTEFIVLQQPKQIKVQGSVAK